MLIDTKCGGIDAELSRKIGISATTISRYFKGADEKEARNIALTCMDKCMDVFNLDPGFWYGGEVASVQFPDGWNELNSKQKKVIEGEIAKILLGIDTQKNPEDGPDLQIPSTKTKKKTAEGPKGAVHGAGYKAS